MTGKITNFFQPKKNSQNSLNFKNEKKIRKIRILDLCYIHHVTSMYNKMSNFFFTLHTHTQPYHNTDNKTNLAVQ